MKKNIVIIGGGPAGMSAAVAAYEAGERDILILERDCISLIFYYFTGIKLTSLV